MPDSPATSEILAAIAAFLRDEAAPSLQGREGFLARVAANAASIVEREVLLGPTHDAQELAALNALLGDASQGLADARARTCQAIRAGRLSVDTPGLLDALEGIVARRVKIEQPNYPSLERAEG